MSTSDERNVDEQLDEQQRRIEAQRQPARVQNSTNNARGATTPDGVIEAHAHTTVTESAKGTQPSPKPERDRADG